MAIEDLDNFEIQYIDFYSELPGAGQRDHLDEKRDYIDAINTDITDLHDASELGTGQGLSDQQVSQIAQDQFSEAGVMHTETSSVQDVTLFSETL